MGVALYGVGTLMLRSTRAPSGSATYPIPWTRELIDSAEPLDRVTRIDMIERLGFIGEPWCIALLAAARAQERDPAVRAALNAQAATAASLRESTSP